MLIVYLYIAYVERNKVKRKEIVSPSVWTEELLYMILNWVHTRAHYVKLDQKGQKRFA